MYVQIVNDVDMWCLQQALTALTDWARELQFNGIAIDCCVLNLYLYSCLLPTYLSIIVS